MPGWGAQLPLLLGVILLGTGAKYVDNFEPLELGEQAAGPDLPPHQRTATKQVAGGERLRPGAGAVSKADPREALGEAELLQDGWGRARRRRRRYRDNRRRYRDTRRRFRDYRRRQHCNMPSVRGTDFGGCTHTTSRRRTTCTARCKAGFGGNARTVTCEPRTDAKGDLNHGHFPSCTPLACHARSTLDQAAITKCALDHTGQKPYSGDCVMTGYDRTDCNGKIFEDTCRVTCKTGWSGDAATLSCPTNQVFSGSDPTCTPNTCAKRTLTDVQTAMFNMSECDAIKPRSLEMCKATCNQGWHHPDSTGPTTLTCPAEDKNGFPTGGAELTGDNPACNPNTCHPPFVVDVSNLTDFSRIPEGVNFTDCMGKVTNETCRVDCKHGWWETNTWSVGKATLRCSESGNFTGDLDTLLPVCEPKPCRPPVPNEPTFHMLYDLFPNASALNPKTYLDNNFSHLDPRKYSTVHQLRLLGYTDDKNSFHDDLSQFSTPLVHGVNFTACQASEVRTGQTCQATCWSGFTNGHSVPGYAANTPMTLTCTADGNLNVTNLTQCLGIRCRSLRGPDKQPPHTDDLALVASTRRRGTYINTTFRNATYNRTDSYNGTAKSDQWIGNVTGANFSTCVNLTTTEQCLPSCNEGPPGQAGFWMKIGTMPQPLTCLETGEWKGSYPKCVLREPLDTVILCDFTIKLGGMTAEQILEDRTFTNKTIDSLEKVLDEPITDVNRHLTIEVTFPGLMDQRGEHTGAEAIPINVQASISFVNASEALVLKEKLFKAFDDKGTQVDDPKPKKPHIVQPTDADPKELVSDLGEYWANLVSDNQTESTGSAFGAAFSAATNTTISVDKLKLEVLNVASPDVRVDPFTKRLQRISKFPLPHVEPNQTVRDPGVTEINVQGRYDRATGQWHKAAPPARLMDANEQVVEEAKATKVAKLRKLYEKVLLENSRTDDSQLLMELEWL